MKFFSVLMFYYIFTQKRRERERDQQKAIEGSLETFGKFFFSLICFCACIRFVFSGSRFYFIFRRTTKPKYTADAAAFMSRSMYETNDDDDDEGERNKFEKERTSTFFLMKYIFFGENSLL